MTIRMLIIPTLTIVSLLLPACAKKNVRQAVKAPQPIFQRDSLEFRLIHSNATRTANQGPYREELRTMRELQRMRRLDDAGVEQALHRVKERMGLFGQEVFVYWERDGFGAYLPQALAVVGTPVLDCGDINDASSVFNAATDRHEVYLTFNPLGSKKMLQVSKKNIGWKLAIVWRKRIISAPRIRTRIPTGRAVISGDFSADQAGEIVRVIRGCLLPPDRQPEISSTGLHGL